MPTVLREANLRFVIYTDDHPPPHVHVFGDGEAKINLAGPDDTPELVWAMSMTRGDIRRAMSIVAAQRDHLLARWNQIHG